MNSLFDPNTAQEIEQRIKSLRVDSPSMWGKMDVAQMMAHCNVSLEAAMGKIHPKRSLIAKLIGGLLKGQLTNDTLMGKSLPTHPVYIMANAKEFEKEKSRFITLLKEFSEGGVAGVTQSPHAFFGKITPMQWSSGTWKHLDHHLRQFGA